MDVGGDWKACLITFADDVPVLFATHDGDSQDDVLDIPETPERVEIGVMCSTRARGGGGHRVALRDGVPEARHSFAPLSFVCLTPKRTRVLQCVFCIP